VAENPAGSAKTQSVQRKTRCPGTASQTSSKRLGRSPRVSVRGDPKLSGPARSSDAEAAEELSPAI